MPEFDTLEPAIDPNNRISFLLDWELTMKCNLDCSYCPTGIEFGSHDNNTNHPLVEECLSSLDFMFEYVDLYMSTKPKGIRYVILNVYGGESLHHPDIVEILSQVRKKYQPYADRWHLTVTTTTNAIVSDKKLQQIIPLIDEFTVSYHPGHTPKQRQQFYNNLLLLKKHQKRQKCVVLMDPSLFQDSTKMINWLITNGIKHLPRQLDHGVTNTEYNYTPSQVIWFDKLYQSKNNYNSDNVIKNLKVDHNNNVDLADTGRACCGGRSLCKDNNYKSRDFFVENKFPDWYCSVNHFFLYVKQINGELYVNKDCRMNFNGTVGPIGNLNNAKEVLDTLKNQIATNSIPIIQCKKYKCTCGLCSPKAKTLETYKKIINKYQKDYIS